MNDQAEPGAAPDLDEASRAAGDDDRPVARRVARGSLARSVGELIAKGASVAFYLVLARELGQDRFGDFIFGLSLSQVFLTFAGLGSEELLARQIARDREEVHRLFFTVSALKMLMLCAFAWVILGIVVLEGYSGDSLLAIMLVTGGVAFERQARNYHAVFMGYERQELLALSLIAARFTTASVGVAALLAGAGIVTAAVIFMCGSATGNLVAWGLMRARLVSPRRVVDVRRWKEIIRVSIPLGLVTVLYLMLIRLDATMLGFLAGGADNNSELGQYGAAHRLIESTMFISWAVGGAMLPWLSRHSNTTKVTLARGYEVGLKALTAILMPIAVGYIVLAEPLIELLYGSEYAGAVTPLRLLGAMTVLFGINTMVGVLMISRDSPGDFARPAAIVIVQNVIFNLILIPRYGADGAAFNAVLSGLILALWTMRNVRERAGRVSPVRIFLTPLLASAALAGALIALGGLESLSLTALLAGAAAYPLLFFALEHMLYPGDTLFYLRAIGRWPGAGDAALAEAERNEATTAA